VSNSRLEYLKLETAIREKPVLHNSLQRWLKENRKVDWIVHQVETKYRLQLPPTFLTAYSIRHAVPRPRWDSVDNDLIPWRIERHWHERLYPYLMLNAEVRLRAGSRPVRETTNRLILWKEKLAKDNHVVDYQPQHPDVWLYVPRRPGIDLDLIRVPQ
jgi:hypothetical protein